MIAIGVTGLPGSGKSIFAEAARLLGLPVVSMGEMVKKEVRRRGLPITPENVSKVAVQLREEKGLAAVAYLVMEEIKGNAKLSNEKVIVIDGVRSPHEVAVFRKFFKQVVIVAIHAPPKERYRRLLSRKREDDSSNIDDLIRRDLRELAFGVGEVIAMADFILVNSRKSLEEFRQECVILLKEILQELNGDE